MFKEIIRRAGGNWRAYKFRNHTNSFREAFKAVAGGACICLGTYAMRMCPYPEIAPLLFAVGILMVMAFDFHLITRFVPTHRFFGVPANFWVGFIVLAANLITAYLVGLLVDFSPTPPDNLFWQSVLGGMVIGLVSVNNIFPSQYKVLIAALLMYAFIILGLPHCVVYAFYNADFPTLLIVVAGNLVGGAILGSVFKILGVKYN